VIATGRVSVALPTTLVKSFPLPLQTYVLP